MRTQAQSLGFVSSMTEGVSPPRHAGAPHLTPVSGGLRFHLAGCPDVLARPLPLPTQAPRPAHWPLQGLALALSLIAGGSRPAAGSRRATSSPTGGRSRVAAHVSASPPGESCRNCPELGTLGSKHNAGTSQLYCEPVTQLVQQERKESVINVGCFS